MAGWREKSLRSPPLPETVQNPSSAQEPSSDRRGRQLRQWMPINPVGAESKNRGKRGKRAGKSSQIQQEEQPVNAAGATADGRVVSPSAASASTVVSQQEEQQPIIAAGSAADGRVVSLSAASASSAVSQQEENSTGGVAMRLNSDVKPDPQVSPSTAEQTATVVLQALKEGVQPRTRLPSPTGDSRATGPSLPALPPFPFASTSSGQAPRTFTVQDFLTEATQQAASAALRIGIDMGAQYASQQAKQYYNMSDDDSRAGDHD